MDQQAIIKSLESRAKALGVTMRDVCSQAGVHETTFSRWKRADKPLNATLGNIGKIDAALKQMESAR